MVRIFGIPNCDTVKRARAFLVRLGVAHEFVDFKKTPPTPADLERWSRAFGGPPVNTRGTTYKKLKDHYEALPAADRSAYVAANPSLIKRPVLERGGKTLAFGFDEATYGDLFRGPR
jgi:arsenate reductase